MLTVVMLTTEKSFLFCVTRSNNNRALAMKERLKPTAALGRLLATESRSNQIFKYSINALEELIGYITQKTINQKASVASSQRPLQNFWCSVFGTITNRSQ